MVCLVCSQNCRSNWIMAKIIIRNYITFNAHLSQQLNFYILSNKRPVLKKKDTFTIDGTANFFLLVIVRRSSCRRLASSRLIVKSVGFLFISFTGRGIWQLKILPLWYCPYSLIFLTSQTRNGKETHGNIKKCMHNEIFSIASHSPDAKT